MTGNPPSFRRLMLERFAGATANCALVLLLEVHPMAAFGLFVGLMMSPTGLPKQNP